MVTLVQSMWGNGSKHTDGQFRQILHNVISATFLKIFVKYHSLAGVMTIIARTVHVMNRPAMNRPATARRSNNHNVPHTFTKSDNIHNPRHTQSREKPIMHWIVQLVIMIQSNCPHYFFTQLHKNWLSVFLNSTLNTGYIMLIYPSVLRHWTDGRKGIQPAKCCSDMSKRSLRGFGQTRSNSGIIALLTKQECSSNILPVGLSEQCTVCCLQMFHVP